MDIPTHFEPPVRQMRATNLNEPISEAKDSVDSEESLESGSESGLSRPDKKTFLIFLKLGVEV